MRWTGVIQNKCLGPCSDLPIGCGCAGPATLAAARAADEQPVATTHPPTAGPPQIFSLKNGNRGKDGKVASSKAIEAFSYAGAWVGGHASGLGGQGW